jgi:hypothetical protein
MALSAAKSPLPKIHRKHPQDLILWGNPSDSLGLVQTARGLCSSRSLRAVFRRIESPQSLLPIRPQAPAASSAMDVAPIGQSPLRFAPRPKLPFSIHLCRAWTRESNSCSKPPMSSWPPRPLGPIRLPEPQCGSGLGDPLPEGYPLVMAGTQAVIPTDEDLPQTPNTGT